MAVSFTVRKSAGRVSEIGGPYKAIITFDYYNKSERALLWADKIIINDKNVPEGEKITNYLQIGTVIKFQAHSFDETGPDRCGWFITSAWIESHSEVCNSSISHGLYNVTGVVIEISKKHGILSYTNTKGDEIYILFLASKVSIFGKRIKDLLQVLTYDEKLQFDAVPCIPSENDSHCSWIAKAVWKGKKPLLDYDNKARQKVDCDIVSQMKQLAVNPKSKFIRGDGQIMSILNDEYGIALIAVKPNQWESVIFHRSSCSLFKLNLANFKLCDVFKEGDKIRIVGALATKQLVAQWVATQIAVYVGDDYADN